MRHLPLLIALAVPAIAHAQTTAAERYVYTRKIQKDASFMSCCARRQGALTVRGDQSLQGVATVISDTLHRTPPERVGWYWWWQFHRDLHLGTGSLLRRSEQASRQRTATLAALREALKDKEPTVRRAAALALARVAREGDQATAALAPLLRDSKTDVRLAATLALGIADRPDARTQLSALLRGRGPAIQRAFAAVGLGFSGPPSAPELVSLATRSRETMVQQGALIGLKLTGDPKGTSIALGYASNGRNPYALRALAIATLSTVDREATRAKQLGRLARERKEELAVAALVALAAMPAPVAKAELKALMRARLVAPADGYLLLALGAQKIDGARAHLEKALAKQRKLTAFAALGLGLLGDEQAVPALQARLKRADPSATDSGALALALGMLKSSALLAEAKSWRRRGTPEVKTMLAESFGLSGDAKTLPELKTLYEDHADDYEVRRAAVVSACLLGKAAEARAWLAPGLASKNAIERQIATRIAGELPEAAEAAPLLLKALGAREDRTRTQAALALGHLFDRARWTEVGSRAGMTTQLGRNMTHRIIFRDDLLEPLLATP